MARKGLYVLCCVHFAVIPDLEAAARQKKGGEIPASAVEQAAQYCMRYIRSRCHEDLDKVTATTTAHTTTTHTTTTTRLLLQVGYYYNNYDNSC